jgi:hypothetical protein
VTPVVLPTYVERPAGLEPAPPAWRADVLRIDTTVAKRGVDLSMSSDAASWTAAEPDRERNSAKPLTQPLEPSIGSVQCRSACRTPGETGARGGGSVRLRFFCPRGSRGSPGPLLFPPPRRAACPKESLRLDAHDALRWVRPKRKDRCR